MWPALTLHHAIEKPERSTDEIKQLLKDNPDLIYELNAEGKTVFDKASDTKDVGIMLCLLEKATQIFAAPSTETERPKWAVYEIINSIYECLKIAQKCTTALSVEISIRENCGKLLAFYKKFIPLFFEYLVAQRPLLHFKAAVAGETKKGPETILLFMYNDLMEGFVDDIAILCVSFTEEEKAQQAEKEDYGFELIKILLKLIYAKLIKFDNKKEDCKEFLKRVLQSPFGQYFLNNAHKSELAIVLSLQDKPFALADGNKFYWMVYEIIRDVQENVVTATDPNLCRQYESSFDVWRVFLQEVPANCFPLLAKHQTREAVKKEVLRKFLGWRIIVSERIEFLANERQAHERQQYRETTLQVAAASQELSQEAYYAGAVNPADIIKKLDDKLALSSSRVEKGAGYGMPEHVQTIKDTQAKIGRIKPRINGPIKQINELHKEKLDEYHLTLQARTAEIKEEKNSPPAAKQKSKDTTKKHVTFLDEQSKQDAAVLQHGKRKRNKEISEDEYPASQMPQPNPSLVTNRKRQTL